MDPQYVDRPIDATFRVLASGAIGSNGHGAHLPLPRERRGRVVLHTHSPFATAFAVARRPIE